MRLASYNVHGCVGRDCRFDPERIADVLRTLDADAVALQEVESRKFGGTEVLKFLAEQTGTTWIAGPTMKRFDADYGNALLTRQPVQRVEQIDISHAGLEPRGAIDATLLVGGQSIRVLATHLGLRAKERLSQTLKLLSVLERNRAMPTALACDFNEWLPWRRPLRCLHREFDHVHAPRSYPASWPVLALDRICLRGHTRVVSAGRLDRALAREASDHLPVFVDFR